ncbi:hypothetical protein JHW43_000808 [Diplocarpon mali]|nr:hypothetical protein JHW43_000808 [Diplocarpon mali]
MQRQLQATSSGAWEPRERGERSPDGLRGGGTGWIASCFATGYPPSSSEGVNARPEAVAVAREPVSRAEQIKQGGLPRQHSTGHAAAVLG